MDYRHTDKARLVLVTDRAGRPHVIELVSELDSGRLTVSQTGAYVTDLEAENHRWAGPLVPPQGGMMWANC